MSDKPDLFVSTASSVDKEAIQRLNALFLQGAIDRIEDLQLRLEGDVLRVQHVGNIIQEVDVIEGQTAKTMCERIKSRAGISQTDFMSPRDGRFHLRYSKDNGHPIDRKLDLRVSIIPTDGGETFCIRYLAAMDENLTLDRIEMTHAVRNEFKGLLREQQGIFIVCGPVGSGKTTLLFSLLNELRKSGKNIKTIEDPVEIVMPGIDQMQRSHKLSFADGIRAMVRQRLHVGLVGEVRDEETAEMAFRVGNTGSLIFFTIHADDASMVISRCEDLGIDRETFANSVKMIVFTRLIRSLPEDHTYRAIEPSESSKNWLEAAGLYDPNDRFVECSEDSFVRKTPLFEVVKITSDMKRAIISCKNPRDVLEVAARQPQYESLTECAVRVAREGRTSLSAVQELIGETVHAVRSRRLDKQLYQHGVITAKQQFECVQDWGERRNRGEVMPLWKVIVTKGFASLAQVIDLIGMDDDAENRVGYFISKGCWRLREHAVI